VYENTLKEFSKRIRKEYGEKIRDIILYGSAARGEARKDSDLDIAVVFEGNLFEAWKKLSAIAFDVMLDTGRYISVQILSPDDLKRLHNPYIKNVIGEGVKVA
jgi:predicted nucleotidyltransferase